MVLQQLTALAEAAEIAQSVVGQVVIEVGRGKNDASVVLAREFLEVRPAGDPAAPVAPGTHLGVHQLPSGRQRSTVPCCRLQRWQAPPPRSKRTSRTKLLAGASDRASTVCLGVGVAPLITGLVMGAQGLARAALVDRVMSAGLPAANPDSDEMLGAHATHIR